MKKVKWPRMPMPIGLKGVSGSWVSINPDDKQVKKMRNWLERVDKWLVEREQAMKAAEGLE